MSQSDVSTEEIKRQLESMDISVGQPASSSAEGMTPEVIDVELEPPATVSDSATRENLQQLNERITGQIPPSKPVGNASYDLFDIATGVWDIAD